MCPVPRGLCEDHLRGYQKVFESKKALANRANSGVEVYNPARDAARWSMRGVAFMAMAPVWPVFVGMFAFMFYKKVRSLAN